MPRLPAIFLSHGSPTLGRGDPEYAALMAYLKRTGSDLLRKGEDDQRAGGPGLRAVLVVSAHWETEGGVRGGSGCRLLGVFSLRAAQGCSSELIHRTPLHSTLQVTGAEQPEQIYDFYGFSKDLYDIKYPARGSTDLARHVVDQLRKGGINEVELDMKRGMKAKALAWTLPIYSNHRAHPSDRS